MGKSEIPSDFQEKIDSIDTEIKKLLRDIDYLGEIGRIDESERLYEEVERLKRTREDIIILAENPSLAAKHMKVCDVCGAMQAINDTEKRNQTHLEGKVHTGFALLRKEMDKLKKQKDIYKMYSDATKKDTNVSKENSQRDSRDRGSHDPNKNKKKKRDRERDDSYERRDRHRHRSHRHGHHSHSRHYRRSRSRDRSSKDKSGERERSRVGSKFHD